MAEGNNLEVDGQVIQEIVIYPRHRRAELTRRARLWSRQHIRYCDSWDRAQEMARRGWERTSGRWTCRP